MRSLDDTCGNIMLITILRSQELNLKDVSCMSLLVCAKLIKGYAKHNPGITSPFPDLMSTASNLNREMGLMS